MTKYLLLLCALNTRSLDKIDCKNIARFLTDISTKNENIRHYLNQSHNLTFGNRAYFLKKIYSPSTKDRKLIKNLRPIMTNFAKMKPRHEIYIFYLQKNKEDNVTLIIYLINNQSENIPLSGNCHMFAYIYANNNIEYEEILYGHPIAMTIT